MKILAFLATLLLLWIVAFPVVAFLTMTTGSPPQAAARSIYNAWAMGLIVSALAIPCLGLFGVLFEKLGRR